MTSTISPDEYLSPDERQLLDWYRSLPTPAALLVLRGVTHASDPLLIDIIRYICDRTQDRGQVAPPSDVGDQDALIVA